MKRVFVGMSGGVDSSVTAALLVEQGFDVTGVYMKNWTQDLPGMRCPWADDLADAKRVAVQLGISLKVYDFQDQYRQKVVDYMLAEYQAGHTPNPDIMCNQEVKFKLFLDTALADGADMIATGHYARLENCDWCVEVGENRKKLLKAADEQKDQTYFLYRVTGEALGKTVFPLGEYTKSHVRKLAEERGLATAQKKDSQGICFVGSVGIHEFLQEFVETTPGNIVDKHTGKTLGRHDGAIYYTLGQRHGLDLGGGMPYYVVDKDMARNEVFVSRDLNDRSMWCSYLELEQIHWINQPAKEGESLRVRLRHRGALHPAIYSNGNLEMQEAERAVAVGQSAVLYLGDEVLGGGIVSGA
ncbi:tRNA 2-thiouridine(34) synthase MnmA [Candidatus Saccharibacteria bacterium]|nr:tRNA 2-thiouridine(34) synthase MnmA [Candidatus Saccharibacteria bacterium]NCU40451.1 tRNA 2-thiouridine(34) synthase MnmA [Candidatus Saccharibacteria bacterium]